MHATSDGAPPFYKTSPVKVGCKETNSHLSGVKLVISGEINKEYPEYTDG